ncbi:MAG: zinc ribbon domain-containing protein [Chloroflexi bacterium]|nr:zinc ribbon domain-containing protein [Chloroflexota bacterium]MCL5109475.1 zinc ribbon domain-containing protein [Chloroflexota bacterium]
MPIYEYRCEGCQTKFELLRSFSRADEPAECPTCRAVGARRLISAFACFSKSDGGATTAVGGGGCSGCSAGSCASCGH